MLRPWSCISMVLWSRISGMHVETNDTVALSLVRYSITPHMKMQTRVPFLYTPPPPTPSTHTIHIKCFTGTQGHTQMGIPFEYTPFVNWKMGVYQNVTPTNVVAYLFEQHKSLLFSDQLNLSAFGCTQCAWQLTCSNIFATTHTSVLLFWTWEVNL